MSHGYRIEVYLEPEDRPPVDLRSVLRPLPSPAHLARLLLILSLFFLSGLAIGVGVQRLERGQSRPMSWSGPFPLSGFSERALLRAELVLPRYVASRTASIQVHGHDDRPGGSSNPVDRLGRTRSLYEPPRPDVDPGLLTRPITAPARTSTSQAILPPEVGSGMVVGSRASSADALTANRLLRRLWGWGGGRGAGTAGGVGDGRGVREGNALPEAVVPVETLFLPILQAYRTELDRLYSRYRAQDPLLRGRVAVHVLISEEGEVRVLRFQEVDLRAGEADLRNAFLRELRTILEQISVSEPRLFGRRLRVPVQFE